MHPVDLGKVFQTSMLQLVICDFLDLDETSKAVDYHDMLCWIKVLSFYSSGKLNRTKKGVTRLFEKPTSDSMQQ